MQNIIGQIIGFTAMGTSLTATAQLKRSRVIIFKLLTDILWLISCVLIKSYPAAITSGIAIFREAVFFNKDKNWAKSKAWLFLFCGIFLVPALLTMKDLYGVMPAIASVCSTCAFWCSKVLRIKLILIVQASIMLVYNIKYLAIAAIIDSALTIIFAIISIIAHTKKEAKGDEVQ